MESSPVLVCASKFDINCSPKFVLRFSKSGLAFRSRSNQRLNVRVLTAIHLNSPRGEVLANVIGCGQADKELMTAFRENWLAPRRKDAKRIFKRGVERGELREDIDAEVAIDALYSPLFYRLLLKHQPLTENFVDQLVDLVMKGLTVNSETDN